MLFHMLFVAIKIQTASWLILQTETYLDDNCTADMLNEKKEIMDIMLEKSKMIEETRLYTLIMSCGHVVEGLMF